MPSFDEKELKAHIKHGEFYSSYLIYGDESYLKANYANLLCEKAVDKAFEALNCDRFEGKTTPLKDIFERASIMPMMSDKRVVVVEDYKLEPLNQKDSDLLSSMLKDLPDSGIVIFLQTDSGFTAKNGKKAISIFEKYGAACELNKRKGNELIKPLMASAAKQGCELPVPIAQYLVSCVGDDYNVLLNELSKVCSYTGEGEITKNHVDAVAIKTVDAKVSNLIRALISGSYEKAYDVLDTLIRQKVEPGYIVGSIIGTYVDMYRAKVASTNGTGVKDISDCFNYKGREFALNYALRDGSRLDITKLRLCLEELSKADMSLKTGAVSETLVIEKLMVKLMLIANGERVC